MTCSPACEHWHNGRGARACLKCDWLKEFNRSTIYRKKVVEVKVPMTVMEQIADEQPSDFLTPIIDRLPEDLGNVIALNYYANRTMEQVAGALGIPVRTAQWKKNLALRMLKREIEG